MDMYIIYALIIVGIIITLFRYIAHGGDGGDNSGSENQKDESRSTEQVSDASGIMFNALNSIGCHPVENKDGSISVQYQGENFHIQFSGAYIGFHSRADIMLHPYCPDNAQYIKAILNTFFDVKDCVRNNFQQIKTVQVESKKDRRPIGFVPQQKNNE